MKIIDCQQASVEWLEKRAGIITASECDEIVSPTGEIRTGSKPKAYLAKKLAEKWQGPLPASSFWNAEQGHLGETDTVAWYEFAYGATVERIGLITTDDGLCGCSPDALAPTYGLEIKSPGPQKHCEYLLAGKVPADYVGQVQFSLWVTKYPMWKFISYRRNYPPLIIDVTPDEEYQAAITEAVSEFYFRFDAGWKKLIDLNGGNPPPKRVPMTFSTDPQPETPFDLIP